MRILLVTNGLKPAAASRRNTLVEAQLRSRAMTCGCSPQRGRRAAVSGGGPTTSRRASHTPSRACCSSQSADARASARAADFAHTRDVSISRLLVTSVLGGCVRSDGAVRAYYKLVCPTGQAPAYDARCTCGRCGLLARRCTPLLHWLRDRRATRVSPRHLGAAVLAQPLLSASCAKTHRVGWSAWPVEAPSPDFRRVPAVDPLFVFTGRLAREKGVGTLLHALARAANRGTRARLRVVGDGPLRSALERLTVELGLSDAVEFTGWLPLQRVEAQLVDAWALVAPSLWAEPLGLTALEAVVRGIPVIASTTGGLAETVEHGVSGLLFANGDPDALASCLVAIASGGAMAGGVPNDTVERLKAQHEVGRHVAWLRALFAQVAA